MCGYVVLCCVVLRQVVGIGSGGEVLGEVENP